MEILSSALDKEAAELRAPVGDSGKRYLFLFLGFFADVLFVSAAFYSAYWLRFHFHPLLRLIPPPSGITSPWSNYSAILPTVILIWMAILIFGVKIHQYPPLPTEDSIVSILSGTVKATIMVLALSFLSKRYSDSRLLLLMTAPVAAAYLTLESWLLNGVWLRILRIFGGQEKIVVIGDGPLKDSLVKRIARLRHFLVIQKKGLSPEEIVSLAKQEKARQALLVQASLSQDELANLAESLELSGIRLHLVPSLLELKMGELQVSESLGVPTFYFKHGSLSGENFVIKRIFDIIFSLAVCVLGFIPFLIIAVLINLDSPGPIFFRQKRYGLHLRAFDALKFRTMVADAESKVDKVQEANPAGAFFKIKNDPRVTRVGNFLRRFSLDEFPQFLNVLMGDMSVVGPRPLALRDLDRLRKDFGPAYKKRLSVLPGLTGLWQVSGRSDLSNEQSVALDTFYIEHWSLGLDLRIILRTIPAVLFGRGAY
jgi:exopolysaccharide biosynthesis polyprenyl glycosylphosphotransferase